MLAAWLGRKTYDIPTPSKNIKPRTTQALVSSPTKLSETIEVATITNPNAIKRRGPIRG